MDKSPATLIIRSAVCYNARSYKPVRNKTGARLTTKRAAMVFRVNSRRVEFLLTC